MHARTTDCSCFDCETIPGAPCPVHGDPMRVCSICRRAPAKPGHAQCAGCLQADRALGDGPE